MRIKFLGTGSVCGVPEWNCSCNVCKSDDPKDKRLRSSVLIEIGDKNVIIDFGPDFRTQLLKYGIKKLDYAFLTHAHDDHRAGYPELSRQKGLIFEAPQPVLDEFFIRLGNSRKWLETRNPSIIIRPFQIKKIDKVNVDVVALEHKKDYQSKDNSCYGYLFKSKGFSFAYLSDYSKILEENKLKNFDLIVSDGAGFENSGRGHMGVKGSIVVSAINVLSLFIFNHLIFN